LILILKNRLKRRPTRKNLTRRKRLQLQWPKKKRKRQRRRPKRRFDNQCNTVKKAVIVNI
jgi:hypothetical protein